jgi:NTP pyrophosphatase (non-canonical NTP hydrolase)
MDLTELQRRRDAWIAHNFPGDVLEDSLLGAVEELGELSHHVLKMKQGIRGTQEEHVEGILDAVADCVIFLAGVCTHLGADYGQLVTDTWTAVEQRDWKADPVKGNTTAPALQQREA